MRANPVLVLRPIVSHGLICEIVLLTSSGLLEEKGVHRTVGNKGPPETGNDEPDETKVSKLDKIKEKLHLKK
jgi:hypothetical protein